MEFSDKDFEKLLIPVHRFPTHGHLFKLYPILDLYNEFKLELPVGLSRIKVLKYIGALYQKHSPFLIIESFPKRQVEVARWAKFDMTPDGNFKKLYLDVLRSEVPNIRRMIIRMCRIQKNIDFEKLVIYEGVYAKELEKLSAPIEKKDAIVVFNTKKNIDAFAEDIKDLSYKFLFEDSNEVLFRELLSEVENEQLELTPELIALKIKNEQQILNYNPYGDYFPSPLSCIDPEEEND